MVCGGVSTGLIRGRDLFERTGYGRLPFEAMDV